MNVSVSTVSPSADEEQAPPGAGTFTRLGKAATLLAELMDPRRAIENLFGNRLLEITGTEVSSGRKLSLLYAGSGHNLTWLLNLLYDGFTVHRKLRLRNPLELRREIRKRMRDADLLVVDAGPPAGVIMPDESALRVPPWVRQRLTIARNWAATEAQISSSARRRAEHHLLRRGYRCDFSTGSRDFFVFYHRLYRPSAKRRYGHDAVIVSREHFRTECRRGYLIRLWQDGELKAAALLQRFGREMASVWGGTTATEEGTLPQGLSDVLDYCIIRHAWRQGCRMLDLGPSRPRLFDGVLQYKKKWGGQVRFPRMPRADLVLKPLRMNAAVTGFLSTAGLVVRDPCGPVAKLLFADRPCTGADLEQLFRRYAASGIERYEVFAMQGFTADASGWASESPHAIDLIDLARSERPEETFCRPLRGSGHDALRTHRP